MYLKAVSRRVSNGYVDMLPWLDVFNSIGAPSDDVASEMERLENETGWGMFGGG